MHIKKFTAPFNAQSAPAAAAALLPLCRADAAAEIVERRRSAFLAELAPFESLLNDEGRALLLALAQTLAQQPHLRSG